MRSFAFFLAFICLVCTSCFTQKDYITDYDYHYQGNFKKYKTFAFIASSDETESDIAPVLTATIGARLGSQGFKEQPGKPDLLVSYKIFTDSIKYRGYVQPEFNFWLERRGVTTVNQEGEDEKEQEKDETYNRVKYAENEGMLVIYVIDNKKGNTIWQGYTAANFDYDSPNFQSDITRAAYRVMNEFKVVNRYLE
jgi:hypothetical protein